MRQSTDKYHGLPLPCFARNLLTNPVAFLASTLGLMGVLALKVAAERRRPLGGRER